MYSVFNYYNKILSKKINHVRLIITNMKGDKMYESSKFWRKCFSYL